MKISKNPFSEATEDFRPRHQYLVVAVLIFFALLFFRLWYLQIIRGHEYRDLSESNRTRVQDILPPRGLILDRTGMILVDNYPSYELAVVREDVPDSRELTHRLAYYLSRPYEEIQAGFEAASLKPAFQPAVILSDLTSRDLVNVETHRYELPGLAIRVKPQRMYLQDDLASHVIGYLGEINQAQLDRDKYIDNRMGDLVGQYGLEMEWESFLHGRRGKRVVEVDASGRMLRVIKQMEPEPGHNLYLTLDARLQRVAQEALGEQAGAVVALDPNTGEVLAMASAPTFRQNDFANGITPEKWRELLDNPLHPLENRAVSGQYPPGSTYKIVSATAALEEGVVTPETRITCLGGYKFGDRTFHCWKKSGHGAVDMHRAIKESCDIYFYEVGRQLGIDRLTKWARMYGLGEPSGVGLANEKPGLTATTAWKKKRFGVKWQQGETLSVVIGQGFNLATPLQMAQVTATIANGGALYRSRLVSRITDANGKVVRTFPPEVVRRLDLSPRTVEVLQRGLKAAVNEGGGTGRRGIVEGVEVAGKTGTAQVIALKKYQGLPEDKMPYKYRDHAWFVCYAPADNPRIAVAVIVEHSGHGGSMAAPVAQKVLDAFFHPDKPLTPVKTAAVDEEWAGD